MSVMIGQVASMTGNNPGGLDNQRGARLAVDELNAAGGLLDGRPVQIVVADDRTRPEDAVTAFRELVRQPVTAVVGTSFSNASLAIIPEAERVEVPYISTGAADSQVEPVRPYAFMTPPTASAVAEQLLRYFRTHGMTKLALGYDDNSTFAKTGLAKQTGLAAAHGVNFVHIERFQVDTIDFGPLFARVLASGAHGLMAWATGPPAVELIRRRPRDLPLAMSHGNSDRGFLDATGPAADGVIAASSLGVVARDLPLSKVRDAAVAMTDAFQRRHGRVPSQYAVDGYTAVRLIAAAITDAGSVDPRRVRDALETLDAITPQGRYRYSAVDHCGLAATQVAVTVLDGGRFVPTDWSRAELAKTLSPTED